MSHYTVKITFITDRQRTCGKGMLSLACVCSRWCVYPWSHVPFGDGMSGPGSLPGMVCLIPGPFQGVGIPGEGGVVNQVGGFTWKVHPLQGTLPVPPCSGHHRSRRYASCCDAFLFIMHFSNSTEMGRRLSSETLTICE